MNYIGMNLLPIYIHDGVSDYFRNSSVGDLAGELTWDKIASWTENISDYVAIAIKGRINCNRGGK